MAKPTPAQRWNDFVQSCSALDLKIATTEDLENIVSTTLQLEYRLAGDDVPPNPVEIKTRTDRFVEARKYFENHTSQLASEKNSVIGVLGEIMGLERRQGVSKDYCTTVAASFLEALPYLLNEREFGGAEHGADQVLVYSLDLILRAAKTEISDFENSFVSCHSYPTDRIASEQDKVAAEWVQSFGLKRHTGPDQKGPFGLKALEVTGLSGHFYRFTLFDTKLKERHEQFERRRSGRFRTGILAATLISLVVGETYFLSQGHTGEDLGDMAADAYRPLPETNVAGREAAKTDAPKKGKRLAYVAPADEGETLIPGNGCDECPRNLQREYFTRLVRVDNGASEENIQTIIDDFRAGLTSDYVIKDGAALVELMFGPKENYELPIFQKSYENVSKTIRDLVDSGKIHLYTEGRKQNPGTLILQPAPKRSSPGGK